MLDHSAIYRSRNVLHWHHRMRLARVLGEVANFRTAASVADVGCSNGYVTNLISEVCGGEVFGFDYLPELIGRAQTLYPHIRFRRVDLNREVCWQRTFELVCCFETLEHAGDPAAALGNLAAAVQDGGTLIVSVPVETGIWGLAKFVAKTAKGYPFDEIEAGRGRYLRALLTGEDLSRFRGVRYTWGTHFGFDWRELEKRIGQKLRVEKAYTWYGTRIIVARKGGHGVSFQEARVTGATSISRSSPTGPH